MRALLPLLFLLAAALALPALLTQERGPLDDRARAAAPGQFIRLSDGLTHYQLRGPEEGDVVVLVNGFSVPSYTWTRNAPVLAASGYRVLTYDTFGRGFSDRPQGPYHRQRFILQLRELMDGLALQGPVHLVGLSMGGAIVAAFAAENPNQVRSVSLLAPLNRPLDVGPLRWPLIGDYLARVAYIPSMPERQLGDFVDRREHDDWVERYRQQMRYDGFENALISTAQTFLQDDPGPDLEALSTRHIPVLLIWGTLDTVFPIDQAVSVREKLGNGHHYIQLEHAGHGLHYEHSEQVNQALLTFLAEH
ncbi:alpha/beta hydrolase [Marinobacter hydrocarbonoclasticus]|nr:alpha/beta hydrolase [Marinobacter nauticus]